MKTNRIIYWISTGFIFLFEGIIPALTSQTEVAKEGIRHLGYPGYFGTLLTVFKVTGACLLIIPRIPGRIKEWVYAGFAFDFIFAFLSYMATDGFGVLAFFPLVVFLILVVSYVNYHRIRERSLSISL
jgi:DoxX-like family